MFQTKFFHTIFFISVLLLCFGTFSEANSQKINFDPEGATPSITGSGSYEVEENIITGSKRWAVAGGAKVSVTISVSASGLGIGQATFAPVDLAGKNYREYADEAIDVGTTTSTGSWNKGTATVKAVVEEYVPSVHAESYSWSAEGKVVLTPSAWKVSVTKGCGIRWPLQIQGTMTITGEWEGQSGRSIPRWAPSGTQGTHDRKLTYYCHSCDQKGDTPESIGGKKAHAIVTCKRSGCGKQYHRCDKYSANLHSIPEGSSTYRCDVATATFKSLDGSYTVLQDQIHLGVFTTNKSFNKLETYSSFSEQVGPWKNKRAQGGFSGPGTKTHTCTFGFHSGEKTGLYLLTAVATIAGTGEKVTRTYTVNVIPTGVSYNKTSFDSHYDTLEVTIERAGLSSATMLLDGQYRAEGRLRGSGNKLVLTYDLSHFTPGTSFYGPVTIFVNYTDYNGTSKTSQHEQYISVDF